MRLYTVQINGQQQPAVALDDGQLCLTRDLGVPFSDMNQLISNLSKAELGQLDSRAKDAARTGGLRLYRLDEVRLCAPIPHPIQDIICLGVNYDEHIREIGARTEGYTVYFSKRVSQAPGPFDRIPSYPGYVDSLDYEAELAVVLGTDARQVSAEQALDHVFGYTILNDITARNLQFRHQQWYLGKSLDGFAPMGPCIVTADELPDVQDLPITCIVNGEIRQSSNTRYMIQPVANAIAELSQGMTLKAGTIIATGTPGGVAMGMKPPVYLKTGDTVLCEIGKIGVLENRIG